MSHLAEQPELAASGTSNISNISTPDTHQHSWHPSAPPGTQENKKKRWNKKETRNKLRSKSQQNIEKYQKHGYGIFAELWALLRAEQIALFGCVPTPLRWDHEHRRLAQRCSCPPTVPSPVMHQGVSKQCHSESTAIHHIRKFIRKCENFKHLHGLDIILDIILFLLGNWK